jgi:hypothetical protein
MLDEKFTVCPAHIVEETASDEIEIVGVTIGFTVIVIPDDVTALGLAQVAFEVKVQVNTSLFDTDDVLYVAFVAPEMSMPFFFH